MKKGRDESFAEAYAVKSCFLYFQYSRRFCFSILQDLSALKSLLELVQYDLEGVVEVS